MNHISIRKRLVVQTYTGPCLRCAVITMVHSCCPAGYDLYYSDRLMVLLALLVHSKHFHEEDFATVIRKKQSASWALKW